MPTLVVEDEALNGKLALIGMTACTAAALQFRIQDS